MTRADAADRYPTREGGADAGRVMARVREGDPDRYAAHLFLPEAARRRVNVLTAFVCELNTIGWRVREPLMGQIRLQWWRDLLPGRERRAGHPVADALIALLARHPALKAPVDALLERRFALFSGAEIATPEELAEWMGAHEGDAFFLLALACLDDDMPSVADGEAALRQVARQAGEALGVARFLAGSHVHPLPPGLCRRPSDGAFMTAARGLCLRACRAVHGKYTDLSVERRAVFLPLAVVGAYLSVAGRRSDVGRRDPAGASVAGEINPLYRYWRLWRAARGRWGC